MEPFTLTTPHLDLSVPGPTRHVKTQFAISCAMQTYLVYWQQPLCKRASTERRSDDGEERIHQRGGGARHPWCVQDAHRGDGEEWRVDVRAQSRGSPGQAPVAC